MANVYFELTRELNRLAPVAALSSGQAVVYYRLAIMSKDGDWIVREEPEACEHILAVLVQRDARYRPAVVAALAQEIDELQQADLRRLAVYQRAAEPYLTEFQRMRLETLPLRQAHAAACRLAAALLPEDPFL
ncbi:MAG: hypothetical protein HYX77_08570 [Acidobacteria bacterium]|nr:hypothetical protein [Acidobacteriota bacterium]